MPMISSGKAILTAKSGELRLDNLEQNIICRHFVIADDRERYILALFRLKYIWQLNRHLSRVDMVCIQFFIRKENHIRNLLQEKYLHP